MRHTIKEFRKLVNEGADPHLRENYTSIAGDHDLKGPPQRTAIEVVLDTGTADQVGHLHRSLWGACALPCDEGVVGGPKTGFRPVSTISAGGPCRYGVKFGW